MDWTDFNFSEQTHFFKKLEHELSPPEINKNYYRYMVLIWKIIDSQQIDNAKNRALIQKMRFLRNKMSVLKVKCEHIYLFLEALFVVSIIGLEINQYTVNTHNRYLTTRLHNKSLYQYHVPSYNRKNIFVYLIFKRVDKYHVGLTFT